MKRTTNEYLRNKMYLKQDDVVNSYVNDRHILLKPSKLIIITRLVVIPRFDFDFTLIEYDLFKGYKVINYTSCDIQELNGVIKNAR